MESDHPIYRLIHDHVVAPNAAMYSVLLHSYGYFTICISHSDDRVDICCDSSKVRLAIRNASERAIIHFGDTFLFDQSDEIVCVVKEYIAMCRRKEEENDYVLK